MSRQWILVAAAVALTPLSTLLLAPIAARAQTPNMSGVWRGVGFQPSPSGKYDSWTISLHLGADGNGTIDYPSLSCGGTVTRLGSVGDLVQFREKITYGFQKCVDGGLETMDLRSGRLFWTWDMQGSADQQGLSASAILFRSTD